MFMFLTRTKNIDYRLREDSGRESCAEGFVSILREAGITGTERPCAVLKDKLVVAAGMKTDTKDIHGRPVRFSFSLKDDEAARVFSHLVKCWGEAEEVMRKCLDVDGDNVTFCCEEFTAWLKDYEEEALLPGHFAKWEKSSGEITALAIPAKKRNIKPLAAAAIALLAVIAFFVMNDSESEQSRHYDSLRARLSDAYSELGLLSGDRHIKFLEADYEYQNAFDEIDSLSGGNITEGELRRLAELLPMRDGADKRRKIFSGDIAALGKIYPLLEAASDDLNAEHTYGAEEKIMEAEGKIQRLKSES